MDLRKISSLVFSAGQRKLPEIVSLVSFNFVLYVQCDENEKKGSAFFPNVSNNVAQLSPKCIFFYNQSHRPNQGQPKETKQEQWDDQPLSQSENKSNPRPLFIWHMGHFSSKMLPT